MPTTCTNRFGRKGGRGIRPWLLLPKVVCVAMYVGGLGAVWFIWTINRLADLDKDDPSLDWNIELVGRLMRYWIVPALLLAICFGVALFLQHPRTFLKLRWFQLKLVLLALYVPTAHFFLSSRLALLRAARPGANSAAAEQFGDGLSAALGCAILIVLIGRLKPRLLQRSRTAPPANTASPSTGSPRENDAATPS